MQEKCVEIVIQWQDLKKYNLESLGVIVHELPIIDSCILSISETEFEKLSNMRHVEIFKNTRVQAQMNVARKTIHADAAEKAGFKGEGVTIAFLDTGISPAEDFVTPYNRILGFVDFIHHKNEPYDDNGHGTHVSGIACGNGYLSKGKYEGIAPQANIVAVKVLNQFGEGDSIAALKGLQWVFDKKDMYQIKVVNLSIGTEEIDQGDPLIRAVEKLWDAGIVVCIAAGNNGPSFGTVTSPGTSKKVITVGASDDNKEVRIWGSTLVNFSGRGPTKSCIVKPDILAPGTHIVSCLSNESEKSHADRDEMSIVDQHYVALSGTSMSTPMVSGAVALLLQKNPKLTPDEVKLKLKKTAINLHYDKNQQGWGMMNIEDLLDIKTK